MAGGGAASVPMTASFQAQMNSKPNSMTFLSIIIVMMGALMFGIDQNNFGLIQSKPSFTDFWCSKLEIEEAKADPTGTYCRDTIGGLEPDAQPTKWFLFNMFGLNFVPAGMAIGCLTSGPMLARKFGRRLTISTGSIICFLGCIIVAYLSTNVTVYMLGRFITGYGCGIACYCLPMYQAEVATVGIRGFMGGFFQFMVAIGGLLTVCLMSVIDDWRTGFMLPGYAGILVGIAVWLCPESPRFVIDRFGKDAGRPVLQRVRKGDVETELEFIAKTLEEEKQAGSVSCKELFTKPGLRLRVFTACYLAIAQQFTGINAFIGFQGTIFTGAGATSETLFAIGGPAFWFQITMTIGCVLSLILIDSPFGGRRKQLNGAAAFMVPALFVAAVAVWTQTPHNVKYAMFVFGFGFQLAWGIIPWFYPAEIFSMQEKENALSLATACNFVTNLVVGLLALPLLRWGMGKTFLMFGLLNVTNIVFVLACVKETKGVPLEDIPSLWGTTGAKDSKTMPLSSV